MNSGATAERVYDALKRRLMMREFRPGERLDPAALAETLSSSVTPVRDALHMLTGELLVETRTSDGFHVPSVDEPGLKDLYDWMSEVLVLAIRASRRNELGPPSPAASSVASGQSADRAAELFAMIGRCSRNAEHHRAIVSLNMRLHAVRTVEPFVLEGIESEVDALAAAAAAGDWRETQRLSLAYHRRRRRSAADIVRALYRAG